MVLQTRPFWREVEASNVGTAIEAVQADVNAFLASMDSARVRAVDTTVTPNRKYGENVIVMMTVAFLEEIV
jgi:hypothetical protein